MTFSSMDGSDKTIQTNIHLETSSRRFVEKYSENTKEINELL